MQITLDDVWFVILVLFAALMAVLAAVQSERLETTKAEMGDEIDALRSELGQMALRASELEESTPTRGAGGRFIARA